MEFVSFPDQHVPLPKKLQTLADWKEFWSSEEEECLQEKAQFTGGNVVAKALNNPHAIRPEDLRLRPDSPGYRAGPDGKDLGADIDLVGPRPAYERWKKTPEYQQWLKDTGQTSAAALKRPELQMKVNEHLAAGQAHYEAKQWQDALVSYSAAIDLQPTNATAWGQRGHVYMALEQWEKAIADLTRNVELSPASAKRTWSWPRA